jgi:hypothetical protein
LVIKKEAREDCWLYREPRLVKAFGYVHKLSVTDLGRRFRFGKGFA